MCGYLLNY